MPSGTNAKRWLPQSAARGREPLRHDQVGPWEGSGFTAFGPRCLWRGWDSPSAEGLSHPIPRPLSRRSGRSPALPYTPLRRHHYATSRARATPAHSRKGFSPITGRPAAAGPPWETSDGLLMSLATTATATLATLGNTDYESILPRQDGRRVARHQSRAERKAASAGMHLAGSLQRMRQSTKKGGACPGNIIK